MQGVRSQTQGLAERGDPSLAPTRVSFSLWPVEPACAAQGGVGQSSSAWQVCGQSLLWSDQRFCSVFLHVLSSPTWILDYSLLGKNSIYLPSWTESGAGEAGTHLVLTHKDALCDGNLRLQGSRVCVRGRLITWISLFLGSC